MNDKARSAGQPSSAQQNPLAERAVLAALMRNPDGKTIIALEIKADHFTQDTTRAAFIAIAAFIADGIPPDAATLSQAVDPATLIEIETSLSEHASAANLPVYVKLLKDCHHERQRHAARQRLAQAAASGAPEHELRAIVESIQQASAQQDRKTRIQWDTDFCQNVEAEDDLIDGYLPACTVGLLFGDSQAYKSFLLIDIAGHLASGQPWRGREVRPGKTLIVAGEGGRGLRSRIQAWHEYHGTKKGGVAILDAPLELCAPGQAEELVDEIRNFIAGNHFTLIALDTLNTHFGPGDENATADMTRFRTAVLRLSKATGATVIIAHHCGHAERDRGRGSRSLYQGVDWEFKLERSGEDFTTLTHTKAKDGPKQPPLTWRLIQQPLPWADRKGRPINSALLVPADLAQAEPEREQLAGKPRAAYQLLVDLYEERRKNLIEGGHNPDQARVTSAEWNDAMQNLSEDKSYRSKIRSDLEKRGYIRFAAPYVYLAGPSRHFSTAKVV